MYVRDTDPLPRNSRDPQTACEARYAKAVVDNMEKSVQNAYAASQMIAGPNSFRSFGPAVVIDVARSQNAQAAAGRPVVFQSPNLRSEKLAAPRVLPLNVTEAEYGSCCTITGAEKPMQIAPQKVIMPKRMPDSVVVPTMAVAPKYGNLCWALRNGAVDASQFDPGELQALQYRCSQRGYTGACIPPPLTALYLDQQRRAGTLPHITVFPSDLDSIPQAPDLSGVGCPGSYVMGGMTGYRARRGLGAPWGDAGSRPSTPGWQTPTQSMSGGLKALLFFGLVGAGVYMAGKR